VTIVYETVISSLVIMRRSNLYLGGWTMPSSLGKKLNELVRLKFRDAGLLIQLLTL
jgi:hypothetical protein